jgi:glutamate racemase
VKIGVFDSGVGGLSVVRAIEKALPNDEIIFANDSKNVPYGTKTPEHILVLVRPIFQQLADQGCRVIVVACNTVSTTIISQLREQFAVPLIAMEPMIKPAAEMTKSGVIAVCATPTTLASDRYHYLKDTFANNVEVIEPDCSQWSYLIEHNQINKNHISKVIEPALEKGSDVIVLGCTHYHWIEQEIKDITRGRAIIIQPEEPVIRQLKTVMQQLP